MRAAPRAGARRWRTNYDPCTCANEKRKLLSYKIHHDSTPEFVFRRRVSGCSCLFYCLLLLLVSGGVAPVGPWALARAVGAYVTRGS